jgi:segregation and condensation protein B
MERVDQKRIVEALVLAAPEPISSARLAQIVPDCEVADVPELVRELNEEYAKQDRAFEIWEVAGGFQLRTRAEFSGYLQQLHKQRPLRLSRPALETLAIAAYRQPVTRAEIEHVRGVDVGAVLKSLMDRGLIRIMGHREVPGRPLLYGTTRRFLEIFGLDTLKGLPTLRELDDLAREQGLEEGPPAEGEGSDGEAPAAADESELGEPEESVTDEELEALQASVDASEAAAAATDEVESAELAPEEEEDSSKPLE